MPPVNSVGEPGAGESHARIEVAGAGNGASKQVKGTAVAQPTGKPAEERPQVLPPAEATAPVPDPTGQLLESLGDAPNSAHLLDKVREGLSDAVAELDAIHIVRSGTPEIEVEVEPHVVIGGRNRRPDFSVRYRSEDWTYVEVAQPKASQAQADVRRGLDRLTAVIEACEGTFALEVFLKRDPTAEEIESLAGRISRGHPGEGPEQSELGGGLGTLYWSTQEIGSSTLDNHGRSPTPGLGAMRVVVKRGIPERHIVVRWPFTDTRAEAFITTEARQLPTNAPGLIMIQTSGAVGAMKAWQPLIERRFQPTIHTRVSAVCLFSSGQRQTPGGAEWRPETKLLINPHARIPLPAWVCQQVLRFQVEETTSPLGED